MNTTDLLHPQTKQQLQLALQNPTHAYLLVGPNGSAKQLAAEWLAQQLLNFDGQLENHSNFINVRREQGKKNLSIAQVKEVIARLSISSYQAIVPKVVVVNHIENLTPEAGNALLKSLEEPPGQTVFILTTSRIGSVLPTIISRTQVVWFLKPSQSQLHQALAVNYSTQQIGEAVSLSDGQPGRALRLLQNQDKLAKQKALVAAAEEFLNGSITKRFLIAKQTHQDELTLEFIESLIYTLRTKFSIPEVATKLALIMKSQDYLQHNLNARLVLENLSLELQ